MFKLKEKYNKPGYVTIDLNEAPEELKQMIKDNHDGLGDLMAKYFDWE